MSIFCAVPECHNAPTSEGDALCRRHQGMIDVVYMRVVRKAYSDLTANRNVEPYRREFYQTKYDSAVRAAVQAALKWQRCRETDLMKGTLK